MEKGGLIYDTEFTVSPVSNQEALLNFCESLGANSDCWIKDLDDFVLFEKQTALPIEENAFE